MGPAQRMPITLSKASRKWLPISSNALRRRHRREARVLEEVPSLAPARGYRTKVGVVSELSTALALGARRAPARMYGSLALFFFVQQGRCSRYLPAVDAVCQDDWKNPGTPGDHWCGNSVEQST